MKRLVIIFTVVMNFIFYANLVFADARRDAIIARTLEIMQQNGGQDLVDDYHQSYGYHYKESQDQVEEKKEEVQLAYNKEKIEKHIRPKKVEKKKEEVEFDFTAPPKTAIKLYEHLYFGARAEIEFEHEDNFNLDKSDAEDEGKIETNLSMAFSYEPYENMKVFLNFEPSYVDFSDKNKRKEDAWRFNLQQAHFEFNDVVDKLDLVIGRQRFVDSREWIYDEEMDAIRAIYYMEDAALDFSVSKENRDDLFSNTDNGLDEVNFMTHLRMALNEDHELGLFNFTKNDYASTNDDPVIFGAQLSGELTKQLEYWVNFAYVDGQQRDNDIQAFGGDIYAIYEMDYDWKPSIILGYAYGSGDDDPNDGKDTNFRQSGLQDNDSKLSGVSRVKYYGELVDPELSNMTILTAGFGIRPMKKLSFEVLYHYYRQNKKSTIIRDSNIDTDPDGESKDLGQEIDIVAGWKINKDMKFSLAFGYFNPGKAFPSDSKNAFFTETKFRYNF